MSGVVEAAELLALGVSVARQAGRKLNLTVETFKERIARERCDPRCLYAEYLNPVEKWKLLEQSIPFDELATTILQSAYSSRLDKWNGGERRHAVRRSSRSGLARFYDDPAIRASICVAPHLIGINKSHIART